MSLLTSEDHPAVTGVPSSPDPTGRYTLTHDGTGWTLLIRRTSGSSRGWSTPLAPHGASRAASPRVAQAVGVRVLHELGVEVAGWIPEPAEVDGRPSDVVAIVAPAVAVPARRGLRGLRGH